MSFTVIDGHGNQLTTGAGRLRATTAAQRWANAHGMAAEVIDDSDDTSELVHPEPSHEPEPNQYP